MSFVEWDSLHSLDHERRQEYKTRSTRSVGPGQQVSQLPVTFGAPESEGAGGRERMKVTGLRPSKPRIFFVLVGFSEIFVSDISVNIQALGVLRHDRCVRKRTFLISRKYLGPRGVVIQSVLLINDHYMCTGSCCDCSSSKRLRSYRDTALDD